MAAMGARNPSQLSLGHGSGDRGADVVDRPYPVIIGTEQRAPTADEITTNAALASVTEIIVIDIDFHVNGALRTISDFDDADLLITGADPTPTPIISTR